MDKDRCKICKFWKNIWHEQPDIGRCVRHSPSEVLLPREKKEDMKKYMAIWPITYNFDWCGEFQPKST
jgi:hypothetical protein